MQKKNFYVDTDQLDQEEIELSVRTNDWKNAWTEWFCLFEMWKLTG